MKSFVEFSVRHFLPLAFNISPRHKRAPTQAGADNLVDALDQVTSKHWRGLPASCTQSPVLIPPFGWAANSFLPCVFVILGVVFFPARTYYQLIVDRCAPAKEIILCSTAQSRRRSGKNMLLLHPEDVTTTTTVGFCTGCMSYHYH